MDRLLSVNGKLQLAVFLMATGRHGLKHRLTEAFYQLQAVRKTDLPVNLHSDYEWIVNSLTSETVKQRAFIEGRWVEGFEGRIGATLAYMRYEKADEIAGRIYNLAYRVDEACRSSKCAESW